MSARKRHDIRVTAVAFCSWPGKGPRSRTPLVGPGMFAALALGALTTAGDLTSLAGASTTGGLHLAVSPSGSVLDTPLGISVSGLAPGRRVTLDVTSVDARGVKWSSSSTFVASSTGTVDPATSASVAGSYKGLGPMGPVDFMTAPSRSGELYSWWPDKCCSWSKALKFTFSVSSGHAHAAVTVRRGPGLPVTASYQDMPGAGFVGNFWQPPVGRRGHAAILEVYGSVAGYNDYGAWFASRGYPTLDLAYFGAPGLPTQLKDIPLEYFAKALRWLARQPGVDPGRVWVMGISYGSEAALLLGVHYPHLVHAVAAMVPNDLASCAAYVCDGPAWTFGGRPVPYARPAGDSVPADNPAAEIPVAQIRGPVLLDCGGYDMLWRSCPSAETIMAELAAAHRRYPRVLLRYPQAGHGVGTPLPYWPGVASPIADTNGETSLSNAVALADQWPKLLAFLQNN